MVDAIDVFNEISIHALREESDFVQNAKKWQRKISIHALREESDSKRV